MRAGRAPGTRFATSQCHHRRHVLDSDVLPLSGLMVNVNVQLPPEPAATLALASRMFSPPHVTTGVWATSANAINGSKVK